MRNYILNTHWRPQNFLNNCRHVVALKKMWKIFWMFFVRVSKDYERLRVTNHKNNLLRTGLDLANNIEINKKKIDKKWKWACWSGHWHGQWRSIYFKSVLRAAGNSLLAELLPECIFAGTKARLGTILTGRGLLSDGILIKCFLFAAHCLESWWLSALNHKAHLGVLQSQ